MLNHRRQVRQHLNDIPLSSFWEIVRQAKISDGDQVVLDLRFVHGLPIREIADKTFLSEDTINKIISRTYDKIAKLI